MYTGLWLCLGSSLHLAFAWKKQQARNLAKAQNQKVTELPRESVELSVASKDFDEDDLDDNDDDDDDLDNFQDADVY
jgi:hypothetical protein